MASLLWIPNQTLSHCAPIPNPAAGLFAIISAKLPAIQVEGSSAVVRCEWKR